MEKSIGILLGLAMFCSCSIVGSLSDPHSDYRQAMEKRILEAKLYERASLRYSLKVIPVDSTLYKEYQALGVSQDNLDFVDQVNLIVAIHDPHSPTFVMSTDIKARLDGEAPLQWKEVHSMSELKRHYSFAFPFYRVFWMKFKKGSSQKVFTLLTHSGRIKIKLPENKGALHAKN